MTDGDAHLFRSHRIKQGMTAEHYEQACKEAYLKTQHIPRWKRMLVWCITNITRIIG